MNSLHIAICDDDSLELAHISQLLDTYRRKKDICLTYRAYRSATELLATMKGGQYDLLLLDILMPGFTGLQAACEVRGFDKGVEIIFLTLSPEFALDSYAVRARDYILKPVSGDRLFPALDTILAEKAESTDGFSVKTQSGMAKILFRKLSFAEIVNKRLYFHLSDGTVHEVHAPLTEYEGVLLTRPELIKVHRAYIVNLWQMSELTASTFITYSGASVPISRLLYSSVRQAYMEYLFSETDLPPS